MALRAAGANKLLKPASTAPRSYGQRHRPWHHGHLNVTHNGGAAGNGLYTTIKYMRSASGIGMDTTIKHLRRTTSGAARNVLGASVKYLRRTTSAAANNGLSTTIDPPLVVQRVLVNSEPHAGARPSVRLCVGPELARCVHKKFMLYTYGQLDCALGSEFISEISLNRPELRPDTYLPSPY